MSIGNNFIVTMGNVGRGRPVADIPSGNHFGAWLRYWRNQRGLTGEALSLLLEGKVSQGQISSYETGRKKPEAPTVKLLALGLGVDPQEAINELLKDEHSDEPEIQRIPDPDREFWYGSYDGVGDKNRKLIMTLLREMREDEKEGAIGGTGEPRSKNRRRGNAAPDDAPEADS